MPSCNLAETMHNKWGQAAGKNKTDLFDATLDDLVRAFMQVTAYYSFLKGERGGTGPRREELRLRNTLKYKDPVKINNAMKKFPGAGEWCNRVPNFVGEEVFGSTKRKLDLPPGSEFDSHRPDKINFSHPRVETRSAKAQRTREVIEQGEKEALEIADADVEEDDTRNVTLPNGVIHVTAVKETDCDVTLWHISRVKKTRSGAACWAMQAVSKIQCKAKIVREKKDTACPTYRGVYNNYHINRKVRQDFHFCSDDIDRCVKGTFRQWVETRPDSIPDVWPVKRGTNLKRREILGLERAGFQLPQREEISPRKLFQDTSDANANLSMYKDPTNPDHVPTSRFEKKLKRRKAPTTDQLLKWASALAVKATFKNRTLVPAPGLGCIIHLEVQKPMGPELYLVTIGKFPECSCPNFKEMKMKSFRLNKAWVNCKHLYYVYRTICKLDELKDPFIHAATLSFNEVKRALEAGVLSHDLK